MSQPKFTPGPWGVERTSTDKWIGPLRPDGKVDSIVVHTVCGEDYTDSFNARQEANANLIAAAPDLYAFAQMHKAHTEHKAACRKEWCLICTIGEKELSAARDAALAKARGEEAPHAS